MNNDHFSGQSIEIRLNPGISLSAATAVKILFKRPNNTGGEWIAAKDGNEIVYTTAPEDTEGYPGTWKLQAYVEEGSQKKYGKIIYEDFKDPLN